MLPGSIPPGTRLDRYRVLGELGRGGMGVVLKAQEEGLDRLVAIKVLPRDLVSDSRRLERFRREAKGAAAVTHPNITTLYTFGEANGWPYMVFEFMAGGSLEDRLKKQGPLPWREVVRIGADVARALGAIHAAGLIHRDLKPANILVDATGRAKLGDFGLVRREEAGNSLTGAGELVGTAAYLSPEQAGDARVDHRADLYAFGATLYALLTGAPPFSGDGLQAITKHLTARPAPPSGVVADIPKPLEKIVLRLLEKKPEARGPDAAELADELEELAERPARRSSSGSHAAASAETRIAPGGGYGEPPAPPRTTIVVAGAVGLVVLAGLAIVVSSRSGPTPPVVAPRPSGPPASSLDGPLPEIELEKPSSAHVLAREPILVAGRVRNLVAGDVVTVDGRDATLDGDRFSRRVEVPPADLVVRVARDGKVVASRSKKLAIDEVAPELRAFLRGLPPEKRPRWPLPEGVSFSRMAPLEEGGRPIYVFAPKGRTIKIDMVHVPAGEFTMGAELGSVPPDNLPHRHLVPRGYFIARTETTWSQYMDYVEGVAAARPTKPDWLPAAHANHPVVNVSWDEAKAFCDWLELSLPDEGQWEKAARSEDERAFPWGGTRPSDYVAAFQGFANLRDKRLGTDGLASGFAVSADWTFTLPFDNDDYDYTAPVGSFPQGASPYGALDMAGNVYELCRDTYDKDAYTRCENGVHRTGNGRNRIVRGGAYNHPWVNAHTALRPGGGIGNGRQIDNTGFRAALEEK